MRNSTIASSIATVVNHVIDIVASAGVVRGFLRLTLMREHLGYWLEPTQPGYAFVTDRFGRLIKAYPMPGGKPGQHCQLRQRGMLALAVCTAPSRLTSARDTHQG